MNEIMTSRSPKEDGSLEETTSNAATEVSHGGAPHPSPRRATGILQAERKREVVSPPLSLERNDRILKSPLPSLQNVPPISSSGRQRPLGASQRSSTSSRKHRIGRVYRPTVGGSIGVASATHLPSRLDEQHEEMEATWNDVFKACCIHTSTEWLRVSAFATIIFLLLYFFLVGLDLMGTAFQVVGGCTAGSLLGSDTNPVASVMIGIVATALLQSSSTTTAIIVSLVSGGLDVHQAIYMVFGANVGTSITSMLVSMAHLGADREELQRAFAGSSVYFIFNLCTLVILFPLEVAVEYLYRLTKLMLPDDVSQDSEESSWEGTPTIQIRELIPSLLLTFRVDYFLSRLGPVKKMVNPLVKKLIIANKDFIEDVSNGESCSDIYPVNCTGGVEKYEACRDRMGVIGCDKDSGRCPAFFQHGASKKDDMVSGWVCMVVALTVLTVCLVALVAVLRKVLLGASTHIIYRATNINPYLAMCIGCGVTILVQSSSITTSTLVPLAGVGVLNLENMFPLVLGADIGTTVTALLAAMVSTKVEALQVALVHLFFNVTGILIWFPIPAMRRFCIRLAKLLGKATRHWKAFPCVFIVLVFFVLPLLLYGISACFEQATKGFTALGVFLLLVLLGASVYFWIWWSYAGGKSKFRTSMELRQRRAAALRAIADDMDYLKVDTEWCKNEIGRLKDFAGIARPPELLEEGLQQPEEYYDEQDDRVSVYESCRSRPWKDILVGSIRSGFGSAVMNDPNLAG